MTHPVAEGVRLNVRRWPGGRPEFLLVHGLASNARLWDEVAARLAAAGHAVHAPDLRGHGESDAPPAGYDTATAAADLAALADAAGLSRLVVAGQSWGASVAVHLAGRRPDLVGALALVDGGWGDLRAELGSWEACEAALRPPELDGLPVARLRRQLAEAHPDWSAAAVEATIANLRVRPDGRLERRLAIPRHMAIVRSMWEDPPLPRLARVRAPTLLVPALPADAERAARKRRQVTAAAAALGARATVREYAAADHDLHAQHPVELTEDLLGLAGQVSTPEARS
ncbi:MAG TPA: alpha/beta hydrolase [Micromonosporaceae bacterium]|nr:alpha/beta hydrolase [Micromonosporaceae bacterium]